MMAAMKSTVSRRVWRMTSDSQLGEYLELRPDNEAHASGSENRAKPEPPVVPAKPGTASGLQVTVRAAASPSREPAVDTPPTAAPTRVKVLRPAQVESWQSSSFDLLSGLQVRDVTDTIPGRVFDELFKTIPATVFSKRRY